MSRSRVGQHPNTGNKYAAVENPKTSLLSVRCTASDKADWEEAAGEEKLQVWVTRVLNKAARKKIK